MRRLAIGLLSAAVVSALAPGGASAQDDGAAGGSVDVLQVSGLFDPITIAAIDDAIGAADADGAQALVLQVDTDGSVVGRDEIGALLERVAAAPIPVALWVGPSGARLYGLPAQLLAVVDVSGMSPGSRVGHIGVPLQPNGEILDFGAAEDRLREDSVGLTEARQLGVFDQRVPDEGIPTIASMVNALDGYEEGGVVLETTAETVNEDGTTQRATTATVRFSKLGLVDEVFHTVASPAVTYLLLLIGLALIVFEFFTAGIGVAGVVGALCLILASTGLATLPTRSWAVALLIFAMLAFAVDVQVGVPRLWTGLGILLTIAGSFWLYAPLPGVTLRPSWLALIAGIGGVALAFVVGMPSMVRTRFATPTIGREWMVGEIGEVVDPVDPDGVVSVGDARWRARTNRATPVGAGDPVRVVAIDGVTLEVEPLEGAARDHRDRRGRRHGSETRAE